MVSLQKINSLTCIDNIKYTSISVGNTEVRTSIGISRIGFREFLQVRLVQPLSRVIKEIVENIFLALKALGKYVKSCYVKSCIDDIPIKGDYKSVIRQKYRTTMIADGVCGSLNSNISSSISKIPHLRERFEHVLGFDPAEGLCFSLCYSIVMLGLKHKEEFLELFNSCNPVNEQTLIDYLTYKKEETKGLFLISFLSSLLPVLNTQNIYKREGKYIRSMLMSKEFKFSPKFGDKVPDNIIEQLTKKLSELPRNHYAEFGVANTCVITKCERIDGTEMVFCEEKGSKIGDGHAMLIYKSEDSKYFFFDPNYGAVGFGTSGEASMTLNGVVDVLKTEMNFRMVEIKERTSLDKHAFDFDHDTTFTSYGEDRCVINLYDATLEVQKAKEFYDTSEDPKSYIVNLCVENGILGSIPVIPQ